MESKRKKRRSRVKGIAETYIHIKDVPRSLTKDEALLYLKRNIKNWAKKSFKYDVDIRISVEDGSLKVRVLVGGVLVFANLVVIYGGFRTGIDYIVKDSWGFSNKVIEQFKKDEHIADQSIIRAERRLGIPGKIQRFYKSIDKINSTDYSHNERQDKIDKLKEEFISIIELLEAEGDRESFIAEIPETIVSELPQTLPAPIRGSITLNIMNEVHVVAQAPVLQMPLPNPHLPTPNKYAIIHVAIRNEDED